jgi:nitrite reductase/ring-hydroxylating ferredoxin subunit
MNSRKTDFPLSARKAGFRLLAVSIALIGLVTGCSKSSSTCNGVPNVAVNFSLDLNSPSNNNLLITGGNVVVLGGYDNIIVYRYTSTQFNAFDCCCPYDGASNAKGVVQLNSNRISVTCPVCGSTYNLADGSVSKGPSKCSLKSYTATYDGVSTVSVTN